MKIQTIAFTAALLFAAAANAQTTKTDASPMEGGIHKCIMATDDAALTSLGLKPEQTTRVKAIQAECKKSCAAAEANGTTDKTAMDKHEADLKAVLTPEQYTNWRKWCATSEGSKAKSDPKM